MHTSKYTHTQERHSEFFHSLWLFANFNKLVAARRFRIYKDTHTTGGFREFINLENKKRKGTMDDEILRIAIENRVKNCVKIFVK